MSVRYRTIREGQDIVIYRTCVLPQAWPLLGTAVRLGSIPPRTALITIPTFTSSGMPGGMVTPSTAVGTVISTVTPASFSYTHRAQPFSRSSRSWPIISTNTYKLIKIAQKIWRNEFVELHDLLPARLGTPEPTILDVLTRPDSAKPRKEIKNIQQWALCFNSYTTVLAQKQPERISDLLAYSSIIIKASEEYDDTPWLQYDARFRRQAATEPKRQWAEIDASLWTTCFALAKAKPRCKECREIGHTSCRPLPRQGTGTGRYQPYTAYKPICRKFNYQGRELRFCNFRHACLRCNKPSHKIGVCPDMRSNQEPSHDQSHGRLDSFREPFRPSRGRSN